MKQKCKCCGHEITSATGVLDALGRQIHVTNVLLFFEPNYTFFVGGVSIKSDEPISYYRTVIVPKEINFNTINMTYEIQARDYETNTDWVVFGNLHKKNLDLYKIADDLGELC